MSTSVPLERPRAFRQIAELVFGRRLDYGKIAAEVRYPEGFLRKLFEAHAGMNRPRPASEDKQVNRGGLLSFPKKR